LSLKVRFGSAIETSLIVLPSRMAPSMLITDEFHAG